MRHSVVPVTPAQRAPKPPTIALQDFCIGGSAYNIGGVTTLRPPAAIPRGRPRVGTAWQLLGWTAQTTKNASFNTAAVNSAMTLDLMIDGRVVDSIIIATADGAGAKTYTDFGFSYGQTEYRPFTGGFLPIYDATELALGVNMLGTQDGWCGNLRLQTAYL